MNEEIDVIIAAAVLEFIHTLEESVDTLSSVVRVVKKGDHWVLEGSGLPVTKENIIDELRKSLKHEKNNSFDFDCG